jgi:hypothetical protein
MQRQASGEHSGVYEDLQACAATGNAPGLATADWVANLPSIIRRRAERCGPIGQSDRRERLTFAPWLRKWIESRGTVKPNTLNNYKYTVRLSVAFMGDKFLDDITPADADGFRIFMKDKGFAEGNIRRRCKQVRQFFNAAVRSKLIAENPFQGLKCGDYVDIRRRCFVTTEQAYAVIAACPDAEWRLIFTLCTSPIIAALTFLSQPLVFLCESACFPSTSLEKQVTDSFCAGHRVFRPKKQKPATLYNCRRYINMPDRS